MVLPKLITEGEGTKKGNPAARRGFYKNWSVYFINTCTFQICTDLLLEDQDNQLE